MNENKLLNNTLELINKEGTNDAYKYLTSNISELSGISGQVYNFLYCLAATSDKYEEALKWMEEAIEDKGLWYRPEVFDDEDLESLWADERFIRLRETSNKKYLSALEEVDTVFTWNEKKKDKLIVVLHGNQQNNNISREYWSVINEDSYQIEYLQSKEIDSFELFRWEDDGDGPNQLSSKINSIEWSLYESRVLAGFSAGCNTILRALCETEVDCDKVILQSPWIPSIEKDLDGMMRKLISKETSVLLICGLEDEDCLPQSLAFKSKAQELGLECQTVFIKGLGHDYPSNFGDIVAEFLGEDE